VSGKLPGIRELAPTRVLPVVVIERSADAAWVRDALLAGGVACAEVTFRTEAAEESIRIMAEDPGFLVGAGTVLSVRQADQALDCGARFIVSPGLSPAVVRHCQQAGVPVFPGVMTPSEVMAGIDLGLSELKFFPAGVAGGTQALDSLAGPFGSVTFIPTGGISAASAPDYLRLANVAAIGGSWLTPKDALLARDGGRVRALASEAVSLAKGRQGS